MLKEQKFKIAIIFKNGMKCVSSEMHSMERATIIEVLKDHMTDEYFTTSIVSEDGSHLTFRTNDIFMLMEFKVSENTEKEEM